MAAPGARPRGQWLVIAAAAAPGIDASVTCFEPPLRRIVPPGETVIVNAANSRLALLYREQGFRQAGAKPLSLSLTTPTAMQATGGWGYIDASPTLDESPLHRIVTMTSKIDFDHNAVPPTPSRYAPNAHIEPR